MQTDARHFHHIFADNPLPFPFSPMAPISSPRPPYPIISGKACRRQRWNRSGAVAPVDAVCPRNLSCILSATRPTNTMALSSPSLPPHPHLLRCRPRQACRRRISCPLLCALVPAPNISTPPPPRHLLHPLSRLLPLTAAGYVLLPWRRRFRILLLLLPHCH